jgi:hypothetical protein
MRHGLSLDHLFHDQLGFHRRPVARRIARPADKSRIWIVSPYIVVPSAIMLVWVLSFIVEFARVY